MNSATSPVKVGTTAAAVLFITFAAWVLRGYVWPTLNSVEVPVIEARLDPSLYANDFLVQESLRFTPRYYYNALIVGAVHAGLPLPFAFAGLHLVGLGSLLMALRAAARSLEMGTAGSAVFVIWVLFVGVGAVGGVYFYTHAPVPAVWAGALAAWGGVFALRSRPRTAFAFFGAAVLLQFLVGFYAGLLALPALIGQPLRAKMSALALWVGGLGLVYVPLKLASAIDDGSLSGDAFVQVYAYIRHPHHLVPSTWGWPAWLQFGIFYLGAWRMLYATMEDRFRAERRILGYALGLAVVALAANYVFVEVIPLALVAKLQPARVTPLVQILFLAALARRVDIRFRDGDYLAAVLLSLALVTPFPGFLLLPASVLIRGKSPPAWQVALFAAAVLAAFQPFDSSILVRSLRYGLEAGLCVALVLPALLEKKTMVLESAAVVTGLFAIGLAVQSVGPEWPPFLAARFTVAAPVGPGPGALGSRFAARTPPGAVVLTSPGDAAWAFKLTAHRAVVVDEKDFPFTDRGIREWRTRMEAVLGRPLEPGLDLELAWRSRSAADLAVAAAKYGARYVLARDSEHPFFPGTKVDTDTGWSVWVLSQ